MDAVKLYESMTRVVKDGYVIRVWRQEANHVLGPNPEVLAALEPTRSWEEIVQAIDGLSEVNAYEILDRMGNGAVVYVDWP